MICGDMRRKQAIMCVICGERKQSFVYLDRAFSKKAILCFTSWGPHALKWCQQQSFSTKARCIHHPHRGWQHGPFLHQLWRVFHVKNKMTLLVLQQTLAFKYFALLHGHLIVGITHVNLRDDALQRIFEGVRLHHHPHCCAQCDLDRVSNLEDNYFVSPGP